MKDKKQHIDNEFLSEEILLQYRQGKLSNAEMRRVEGLLEKYPLYAEALEGLELVAESKSQESIAFLREFADKQVINSHTAKIIPLRRTSLMRVAAAIALLFVCSLGIYFLNINSEMMSKSESTTYVPPPSDTQKLMEESSNLGRVSEQAEASNKEEIIADIVVSNENELVSKPKQEALNDKQTNQLSKPIQIKDSLLTLARKNKDSRSSGTITAETDAVLAEKIAEEEEKPKSTTAVVTPAPIQSSPLTPSEDKEKDKALGGEVVKSDDKELKSNNSTTDDDLVEKDTKKAKKKVLRERSQRTEISSEKQSASVHGIVTSDGLDQDLKATLKQQILDLAKAQNETPKGKFSVKITFTKGEKQPKVTIQTMPCQACKTDTLIKTIENHQFTDKTERVIEIAF